MTGKPSAAAHANWRLPAAKPGRRLCSRPVQWKRVRFALYSRLVAIFNSRYWPAAGDTTLGVASVLLLLGALVPDVELLFVPLGRPEFGALLAVPLSELVAPGAP